MNSELYNYRAHLSNDIAEIGNRIAHHNWEAQQLEARKSQLLDILSTLNKTIATIEQYEREQREPINE